MFIDNWIYNNNTDIQTKIKPAQIHFHSKKPAQIHFYSKKPAQIHFHLKKPAQIHFH